MTSRSSASAGTDDPFEQALRRTIQGEVHFDPITKRIYSVDASIYEVEPIGVVVPRSREELCAIAALAAEHKVPLIARGAATGVTGGCIGRGLIVDTSKYLTAILEINSEKRYARCEPGVVQDQLNSALAPYGLRLGPDTSTGNRATLGGMAANNAAGAHSLIYGTMADQLLAVELLLAGGEQLRFEELTGEEWEGKCLLNSREGEIYRTLKRIKESCSQEIATRYPAIPRHVSGYNLEALIKSEGINASKLIAGSEGSLGIISELTLNLAPCLEKSGLCLLFFDKMIKGMEAIEEILTFSPIAVEMVDSLIIESGRRAPSLRGELGWLESTPDALFIVEFQGESDQQLRSTLEKFARAMEERQIGDRQRLLLDPATIASVWKLRKAGLGLLLSKRSYSRAIAFIEDLSVPPFQLASFIRQFRSLIAAAGKETGIYGHVGSGCMHLRPFIDLRSEEEVALMKQLMEQVTELVITHNGSLSGEHGDGFARSWLNERLFGKKLYTAFVELKRAFDPEDLMNPHTIVNGLPPDRNLRLDPQTSIASIPTFQDFSREGGFSLAVDLCNGNGQCRKPDAVMCPSFQATNDEFDTTRARAQALRAIVNGKAPIAELTSDGVQEVLDLCLECKGCKGECPSQVDMAKIKAELLFQKQEKEGYTLRSRLFGRIAALNAFAAPFATLFNLLARNPLGKALLAKLGIAPERNLPPLVRPFSRWWHQRAKTTGTPVALYIDTFTQFNTPDVGISGVKILEALGHSVEVIEKRCCGRPAISKGLLKEARRQAAAAVKALVPYAEAKIPILCLEPSCFFTLKEDLWALLDTPLLKEQAEQIAAALHPFDSFIAKGRPLKLKSPTPQTLFVHGHCHQKSCGTLAPTLALLNAIEGVAAQELATGCCGMAGSFGYESEHYNLSMAIGELRLFPLVRAAPEGAIIIADGSSCRQQILHGTGKQPLHLAQFLSQFCE